MLIGMVKRVVVDHVHKEGNFVNIDVHDKQNKSETWQIKKIINDLNIDKNWELMLWSAIKLEYIKMDETMPDQIHVIDALRFNTKGNIDKSYTLYRRSDNSFTRRTPAETRQTNRENAQICHTILESCANQRQ